jgi:energy-coupling factor transporter ATP-binding protein EcfA2
MKAVIIVCGYSGSGKSTLVNLAMSRPHTLGYHIATPFKDMMRVLWGVDVDDRDIRENHRPNGGQTVGELMASAFKIFRVWDPNILIPGLHREILAFSSSTRANALLIDGVRTISEVDNIIQACDLQGLSLGAIKVVRANQTGERWEEIDEHIHDTMEHLGKQLGAVHILNNNRDSVEDWEAHCTYHLNYWGIGCVRPHRSRFVMRAPALHHWPTEKFIA